MDIAEEIRKLEELRRSGALSEEEFARAKAAVLSGGAAGGGGSPAARAGLGANQWAVILHLSLLAGYVVPFAGLVAPIVIWQIKKDEFPVIDAHGKNVANWLISLVIYILAAFVLMLIVIGIPLMVALGVVGVVFPIIGAVKANNGEVWKYPMSIPFLK